ncbi:XRE family transcriptional regulator [Paenibacillus sp. y28]|uniref:XRE family transcriptional regulator n=1 Tax=Paenibacillus sp. y28 TaxID=3129110 RepID=UPI00301A962D
MQTETKYNHKMVILARESRGISQTEMSKLSGFSQGKISKIENGLLSLSDSDIEVISSVLDYPVHFFQRTERIYGVGLSEFYHRKRQSVPQKALNKIYAKLELRRMEISSLLKSVEFGEHNYFFMDPDQYNIESIAQAVRAAWKIPKGPVDNLVQIAEEMGAIIVPFDFEGAKIDGISVSHPGVPPLIFMNYSRPMDRIRFTLAHEIGHLIMHRVPPSNNEDIEEQADKFASEFLMPRADIQSSFYDLNLKKLAALKMYWKVSMAALLKRAGDLGKVTERYSRYLWMQMGTAGYRNQEPLELTPPQENPTLLDDIIEVHQTELSYSPLDLSMAIGLNNAEFQSLYLKKVHHLRLVTKAK